MILSFLIILLITLSGTILTYVYETEDFLLARLAAGNVIGSTIFGIVALLCACAFGFSPAIIILSILVTLLPVLLLLKKDRREKFGRDCNKAKGKLEGANLAKLLNFAYFAGFIILFYFFFDRAMIIAADGIFTGGSNNLGDLPFHLGAIFSFTEINNFPPENPSFAYAKFTYPFVADLIAACFVKLGATARDAMLVQNITLAVSLIVLFEKFVFKLTNNKRAGKIACVILLFSGGLGFILFFRDYWRDGRDFFEFIWKLPKDYTILPDTLRWGNSLTTLFLTQRGMLLGMPLTLIVLTKLWDLFSAAEPENEAENKSHKSRITYRELIFVGLLAGTLPLVHVHSLAVLFVVSAYLFPLSLEKWREWLTFGAATCACAVPELAWTLTGSASNIGKFIGWHFGWDARDTNIFYFWAINVGLFAPLLLAAIILIWRRKAERHDDRRKVNRQLLLFYIPFVFMFIISNATKLAPWEWDNIKILIYWFAASVPFVAWLLARWWEKKAVFKLLAAACLIILCFSGALDVWRTVSQQINYPVFDADAVNIAEQIKQKTAPDALFLNAPSYNSPVVLAGRRSFMRYIGHLSSYGIDYEPRYDEVKRIYEGTALADGLLQKNQINYVLVNSGDAGWVTINEEYFSKYPKIAEAGQYRVYQIKQAK